MALRGSDELIEDGLGYTLSTQLFPGPIFGSVSDTFDATNISFDYVGLTWDSSL